MNETTHELVPVADAPLERKDERGSATAEYAVMVLVAIAFASVLFAAVKSPEMTKVFTDILKQIAQFGGKVK